jgi:hypothetical protein
MSACAAADASPASGPVFIARYDANPFPISAARPPVGHPPSAGSVASLARSLPAVSRARRVGVGGFGAFDLERDRGWLALAAWICTASWPVAGPRDPDGSRPAGRRVRDTWSA